MVFDGKIEKSKWRESYFSDDDRSEDMKTGRGRHNNLVSTHLRNLLKSFWGYAGMSGTACDSKKVVWFPQKVKPQ